MQNIQEEMVVTDTFMLNPYPANEEKMVNS